MKVVGCQWDLAWEEPPPNYIRVDSLLTGVGRADLVVLPEMFSTGFSMDVDTVAEDEPAESAAFLRDLARRKRSVVLAGLVRRDGDGFGGNELIAYDPEGEERVRYRKVRCFRYAGETEHYRPGRDIALFDWMGWRVAPFICYDLRFPELFRRATGRGAELFLVIANWPTARVEQWIALLRARAIENLGYVVGVNRCGADPSNEYPGRSVVVDPQGEIVADAGDGEGLLQATLDIGAVRGWRREFPALEDLEES